MSDTSNIINSLRTIIPALTGYSDKIELPNSYFLAENDDLYLKSGWGIKLGGSGLSDFNTDYTHAEDREISIILTQEIYTLETNASPLVTATDELMNDVDTLKVRLLNLDRLGVIYEGQGITFVSNSGIEFVRDEQIRFVSTETVFSFDNILLTNR